jgi:hypothetical protein
MGQVAAVAVSDASTTRPLFCVAIGTSKGRLSSTLASSNVVCKSVSLTQSK